MQSKKPTLNDIAKQANVSIGTVDRAMNDRGRIAPDVKQKILDIADEIGYKKNIYASLLASKNKVKRLAYLLPARGMDGYWDLVLEGIQKAVDHNPIETFVLEPVYFDLHDPQDFLRAVRKLKRLKAEVLLTAPLFDKEWPELMRQLAELGMPYVIINTFPARVDANYLSYIGPDSYSSGKLAGRLMNYHCSPGDKVLVMPLEKAYVNARHMVEKRNGFQEFFPAAQSGGRGHHLRLRRFPGRSGRRPLPRSHACGAPGPDRHLRKCLPHLHRGPVPGADPPEAHPHRL